jgi:glycosyltransferase involved in cell wall biosynthesis
MTKQIKILYFIQLPPPVHGVSTINDFIYHNAFINKSIDKHLVEIKFSNDLKELRKITFRKIIHFFRILKQLSHAIQETGPDYVYFSIMPVGKGFWRDLLFVRQIRKHGIKIIYHLHNRGMAKNAGNLIFRKLYQYIYQDSIIIHLSESLMRKEIGGLNLNGSLTKVIPNGVPVVELTQRKKEDSITRILFVSNLFPDKGMFDLLQIMKILQENGTDARLQIVGEFMRNGYRRRFIKMIDKYGLDESVYLVGPKFGDEKWKAYQDSDIFLFPTRFKQESFPLVILEAMQFGLPVLAGRIGAIPEIINHGENGFIFDPSDHKGFAGVIMELIEQKEILQRVGLAARQDFLENYTTVHLEKNIRDLYESCLFDIR